MAVTQKRLDALVMSLIPEEKARWVIEGPLLGQDITKAEEQQILKSLSREAGLRYNLFLQRFHVLHDNIRILLDLLDQLRMKLLERDRLLWFYRGIEFACTQIAGGVTVGPKGLEANVPFVAIRFERLPRSKAVLPCVSLRPLGEQALTMQTAGIRLRAAECKAVASWVRREAAEMKLGKVMEMIDGMVAEISQYDRPLFGEADSADGPGLANGALFPVKEQWALVWEEITEDEETAQRIADSPADWTPPSLDASLADLLRPTS